MIHVTVTEGDILQLFSTVLLPHHRPLFYVLSQIHGACSTHRSHVWRHLLLEQLFSEMKYGKSRLRSLFSYRHFHDILLLSTSSIEPDIEILRHGKQHQKKKGMVLYSAVSSPLDRSQRFTLSSPGRPVHSDTVLGFSWKHSSHAAIAQRPFTHISTTIYSQVLIYTAESTEAS